jgi:predicted ATPase
MPSTDPSRSRDVAAVIAVEDVRAQLERIVDSRSFRASRRTGDVLRVIVEHTLADSPQPLKERTIAVQAMGRPPDFDPRLDASVRVQVRRLRATLDEYYRGEGADEPLRIEIPVGGYRAVVVPNTGDGWFHGAGPVAGRAPLTSFVGRADLLELVATALDTSHRLVTLTGPGGSGKTRVALEVLARRRNPTSAAAIELAPLADPSDVPMAILNALGLASASPGSTSDRTTNVTDRLVEVLQRQPRVLLVDNCEHLVDAVAALAEDLLRRCPMLTILATSREPLALPGEVQLDVPPLPLPATDEFDEIASADAVRLFVDRVQSVDSTFVLDHDNAAAVAEICRRIDGIPLALELAAARTRAFPVLALAAKLHDRLTVLDGVSRTAAIRQRTLRSMIDWSFQLLEGDERAMFAACSVFVGGARLDAITSIASSVGIPARACGGLVAGLVQKSLLVVADASADPRYTMLETIREFAAEQLGDRHPAVADAHLAWVVQLVATWGSRTRTHEQMEALDRLDDDHDNVRAALSHAVANRRAEPAAAVVTHLGWFWWARGHVTEGRRWLDAVIGLGGDASADLATAMAWACQLGFVQHALEDAAGLGRKAVAMLEVLDPPDADRLAEARLLAANPLIRLGEVAEALELLRASEAHLTVTGEPWGLGSVRLVTGLALTASGELRSAREQFEAALSAYRGGGDGFGLVRTLFRVGDLDESVGDFDSALRHCDEGLRLAEQLGLAESAAERTVERGRPLLTLGERDEALEQLEEGLAAARRLALPDTLARGQFALGLATLEDDLPAAIALLAAAANRFEAAALHREASAALIALLAHEHDSMAADELLSHIVRCAEAVRDHRVLAFADEARALVFARQGALEEARRALTAATERRLRTGLPTPWWLAPSIDAVSEVVGPVRPAALA